MPIEDNIDLSKIAHLSYKKRNPLEIVKELRSFDGRNDKTDVMRRALENDAFYAGVNLCYNPRIKFFIRKIPEYTPIRASAYSPHKVIDLLRPLYQREVTGNAAIQYLKNLLESSDEMTARFVELVINRDLDCGVSVSTINKVSPNLIPVFPVQLCAAFDEKALQNFSFPALIQPKMDGMRCTITINSKTGAVDLFLRNGNSFDCPTELSTECSNIAKHFAGGSVALDGELTVAKEDGTDEERKVGNGILTRLIRGTADIFEINRVRFTCWDVISLDDFWKGYSPIVYDNRLASLRVAFQSLKWLEKIRLIKTELVYSTDSAKTYFQDRLAENMEGAVLKSLNGAWRNGRQNYCLKLKAEVNTEAEIISSYEGNGKYVGMLGGFKCRVADQRDIEFEVGSGFSDAQREDYWKRQSELIGKIITVQYNCVISSGTKRSLYLPVFVELRVDL
jgi:ATP-dependent DNA ligase